MTEIYNSSKGPKVIADMPYRYLSNALALLEDRRRLIGATDRDEEIESMTIRKAALDAEYEAQQAAEAVTQ